MPALQSISILDRTPVTPVAHVFQPKDVANGNGMVVNSTDMPVSDEKLTISMRKQGNTYRGALGIAIPVVATEVINGVSSPKVVRTAYVNLSVNFDALSTTQERTNIIGMLADALGTSKTLVHKALVDLEGVYG